MHIHLNDEGHQTPSPENIFHCHYLYSSRFKAGPNSRIKSVPHLFWHAEFVKNGTLVSDVASERSVQDTGAAICIPPETPHSFIYREKDTVVFSVKFEIHNMQLQRRPYTLESSEVSRAIFTALDTLLLSPRHPPYSRQVVVNHLIASLVSLFVYENIERKSEKDKTLADQIKELIDSYEGRPVTVKNLAEQIGYSENYIRSQFKKEEGIQLKKYIDQQRALVAERYLAYSDIPIKEIVAIMDFPDPQCFSRFCQRCIGRSPKTLRNAIRATSNITDNSPR
jgi:AraC-like DNA-binding protein